MTRKTYRSHDFRELLGMMPADARRFMEREASRRGFLGGIAGMSALGLVGKAGAQATPGAEPTSNVWTPPEDAAPLEEQVWRVPSAVGAAVTLDFYEAVYQRPAVADLFSPALVFLTKNFEIVPG
jgi:hypothetical protein